MREYYLWGMPTDARKRKLYPWIGVTGSCDPPDEVLESELSFFERTGSTLAWGAMYPVTVKLIVYCEEVKTASRTLRGFVTVELPFTQSTPKKSQHSNHSQLQKKQHFFFLWNLIKDGNYCLPSQFWHKLSCYLTYGHNDLFSIPVRRNQNNCEEGILSVTTHFLWQT